ncbi:MAG: hypothetical protein Mars2KO_17630 [Maribacter sp.]|uniref:hypothetical protein n=1 Tax=Maribacter sp. 2307UL18-2 TaxID=3386274 RepID=UPI0039BC99E2
MKSDLKELNQSSLVMRLERNQTDLLKMKSALSSYTCEPRTPSLFERCETLKYKLERLSNAHEEILQSLKGHKISLSNYMDRAKQQFQEFSLIQKGVEEYIVGARNH